ncbi:CHAT domain-containing protein [Sphaerisporangium melleum]|uniref:CHAT domain-containing protein n=1 Tax=Sphaerisporangium melleum TaxID=321316 RepID=UPI001665F26D|nr:CHAT domain-containing protein [Sphaerisporangium melleum]
MNRQAARLEKWLRKRPDDVPVRVALAWFHWLRAERLTIARGIALWYAIRAGEPLFFEDFEALPAGLATVIAEKLLPEIDRHTVELIDSENVALLTRFTAIWSSIVKATPASHPEYAERCFVLTAYASRLASRDPDPAHLETAIASARAAAETGDVEALVALNALLHQRYMRFGDPADLAEGIALLRGSTDIELTRLPLGGALMFMYMHTEDPANLQEAVAVLREAVAADTPSVLQLVNARTALAGVLGQLAEATGDDSALSEAIDLLAASLAEPDLTDDQRWMATAELAQSHHRRSELTDDPEDLNTAMGLFWQLADKIPSFVGLSALIYHNFAVAAYKRYAVLSDEGDLIAALAWAEAALEETPPSAQAYAQHLHLAGLCRYQRFMRYLDIDDGEAAVRSLRDSVERSGPGHPVTAPRLDALIAASRALMLVTGRREELTPVLHALRTATAGLREDSPDRPLQLANLGHVTHDLGKTRTERDEGVRYCREAVAMTNPDDRHGAYVRNLLGEVLSDRYLAEGATEDKEEAIRTLEEVVASEPAVLLLRIDAAAKLGMLLAADDPGRAADLLRDAVAMLAQRAPRQLRQADQFTAIAHHDGLAADAAALALAAGRSPEEALAVLESGRGVLLGQVLDLREDLSALRAYEPGLADRLTRLRSYLESTTSGWDVDGDARDVHARHQAARELEAVLGKVRALPGFEGFARPPDPRTLLTAGGHGPVVVLTTSRHRTDALLVTAEDVTCLPLRELTRDAVENLADLHEQAIFKITEGPGSEERQDGQRRLTDLLGRLWDEIMEPVLTELRVPVASRLWLVPCGPFARLPLHAAGHHTDRNRNVLDRVIPSYSPTLRTLLRARERESADAAPADSNAAVVVAMPSTPGHVTLGSVGTEITVLRRHLPGALVLNADGADPPAKETVLAVLRDCSIAHFACHAASAAAHPSFSHLVLRDDPSDWLRVADLAALDLGRARLAYLSACETASQPFGNADEAVHLTGALHLAGFPHVIGTLWPVGPDTATVTEGFYTRVSTDRGPDPARSAEALHAAVRAMRDGDDLPGGITRVQRPFVWATYVHVGP